MAFGTLIQDENPLHRSWHSSELPPELQSHPLIVAQQQQQGQQQQQQPYTRPVVHGMLVASLFSSLLGTLIPGAVYVKQSLRFQSPVWANEWVMGRIDITRIQPFPGSRGGILMTCNTRVLRHETECVTGQADVWLPHGTILQVTTNERAS